MQSYTLLLKLVCLSKFVGTLLENEFVVYFRLLPHPEWLNRTHEAMMLELPDLPHHRQLEVRSAVVTASGSQTDDNIQRLARLSFSLQNHTFAQRKYDS